MATQAHTFEIDGMTGDVCVKKVRSALEKVDGVTIDSVGVGTAQIHCDDTSCDKACRAIDAAGYPARERKQDMSKNQNQNSGPNKPQNQGQDKNQQNKAGMTENETQTPYRTGANPNYARDDQGSQKSKSRSDQDTAKAPGSSAGLGQSKNRSDSDQDQNQSSEKNKVSSGQGSMNASQAKENMISEGGSSQDKSRDGKGKTQDPSRSQNK